MHLLEPLQPIAAELANVLLQPRLGPPTHFPSSRSDGYGQIAQWGSVRRQRSDYIDFANVPLDAADCDDDWPSCDVGGDYERI